MFGSLSVAAALALTPAQAGGLQITNVRTTYGELGALVSDLPGAMPRAAYGYPVDQPRRANSMAVASLVCGLLEIFFGFTAIPAVMEPGEFFLPYPVEVEVGGATIFVLDVDRFERV